MLSPSIEVLWERLQTNPLLRGFVLVGGTALTLNIHHRKSEDLDFCYSSARLPEDQIKTLLRQLEGDGVRWSRNDSASAMDEFEIAGDNLHHYQQNFVLEGESKLTFFADSKLGTILGHHADAPLRVATLKECFAMKSLVLSERSESRDWFDLYCLTKDHGFTVRDMEEVYAQTEKLPQLDVALQKLASCPALPSDRGYGQLLEGAPTLETMRNHFSALRSEWEVETSVLALDRNKQSSVLPSAVSLTRQARISGVTHPTPRSEHVR